MRMALPLVKRFFIFSIIFLYLEFPCFPWNLIYWTIFRIERMKRGKRHWSKVSDRVFFVVSASDTLFCKMTLTLKETKMNNTFPELFIPSTHQHNFHMMQIYDSWVGVHSTSFHTHIWCEARKLFTIKSFPGKLYISSVHFHRIFRASMSRKNIVRSNQGSTNWKVS